MSADKERFRQASELFEACREHAPTEREEILRQVAADDPELHGVVRALLIEHDAKSGLFDARSERTAAADALQTGTGPQPGTRIGPYTILDTLGEGGMGTVYLAEQREPIRRRVALKVVRLGMDSARVLQRFEAERQALALMNHDAIARVFDAGTTEHGQPYFVMEHAPGIPIAEYCDRNKLSVEQRIRLFQQVCAGVQHAHHKGVIHRDLKPGNVLVTEEQGEPKPKIIDFGLARATDHMLLQQTMFTEVGHVVGTPEYMSPEQADPTNADIDTRTDIYALGVMLYELLVGERPFSGQDLRRAGLLEMQRVIREVDPQRPSTRLSSLGEDTTQTAAKRRTTIGNLQRVLRNDLDWVVLKAMEKDRNRRYESAAALASDLSRHLADQPVLAGPPALGYRLRKFARRYRVQVTAAGLVLASLMVGLIGTIWFALEVEARNVELEATAYADALQQVQDGIDTGRAHRIGTEHLEQLDESRRGFAWQWLRARVQSPTPVFVPTGGTVRSLELSADGSRLLTVTNSSTGDGRVRVYSTDTQQELLELRAPAFDAVFGPDGTSILTGSIAGGEVALWDADSGEQLARAEQGAAVRAVCFSRDGQRAATGSVDGAVRLWRASDLRESQPVAALPSYGKGVRDLEFSPDDTRLLVAGDTGEAQIHEVATGQLLHPVVFSQDGADILSACFSPDGELVLLGGDGGRVALWSAHDGSHVRDLGRHQQEFNSLWTATGVAFGPDGRWAFSCGYDNLVRVHSVGTGSTLGFLRSKAPMDALCVGARGARIIAGVQRRDSHGFSMWNLGDLPLPMDLVGHADRGSAVYEVRTTADGRFLFSINGYSVRKWDLATGAQVFAVRDRTLHPRSLDLRPTDEAHVAVSGMGGHVAILDALTGRIIRRFAAPPGALAGSPKNELELGLVEVRYSPDGRTLAAGVGTWAVGRDAEHPVPVLLFDAETGEVDRMEGHHKTIGAICFSPDGKRLVVCDYTNTMGLWNMVLWNIDTDPPSWIAGAQLRLGAYDVAFDPSGERFYVPSSPHEISVFDTSTGERQDYPVSYGASVHGLDFDARGRRLLVVRNNGADLWDLPPRHRLLSLPLRDAASGRFMAGDSGLVAGGGGGVLACHEIEPRPDLFAARRTAYRAARWVQDHLERDQLVADVQAALRAEGDLDASVRAAAEAILAGTTDDPLLLHREAWWLANLPDANADTLARAVRYARAAVAEAAPGTADEAVYRHTLGVALDRSGDGDAGAAELARANALADELGVPLQDAHERRTGR